MRKLFLVLLLMGAFAAQSSAQHEHHTMQSMEHPMSHAYSLNLPMSRNGSGTSWLPDETPVYMYMTGKKTMWMFHGSVFECSTYLGLQ